MAGSAAVVRLPVKVLPGSSRNAIGGWLEGTLRVKVCAPPERGKANAAVEALLARSLGLPAGAVAVVAGKTAARKVVQITGLPEPELRRRLLSLA
ncbi:MAG: DUF167 domain-containing protein [Halioglobus sp.]|nr:DUF167 domain-containing protein [Halioglobus sp.]